MQSNLIRTSQPQGNVGINLTHPLASRLIVAAIPSITTPIQYPGVVTKYGLAGVANVPLSVYASDRIALNGVTIVGGFIWLNATPASYEALGALLAQYSVWPSNMDEIGVQRYATNSNRLPQVRKNTPGIVSAVSIPWVPGDYVFQEIVCGDTSSSGILYENNQAPITMTRIGTAGKFSTGIARTLNLGGNTVAFTHAFVFEGTLSDTWRMALRRNPWQLFQPEKRSRLWAAPVPSVKMTPLPAKGPSIITKPRTSQPQRSLIVDWNSELGRQIDYIAIPALGALVHRSRRQRNPIIRANSGILASSKIGQVWKASGNALDGFQTTANFISEISNGTSLSLCVLGNFPSTTGSVLGTETGNGNGLSVYWDSNQLVMLIANGLNTLNWRARRTAAASNGTLMFGATWANDNTMNNYINGRLSNGSLVWSGSPPDTGVGGSNLFFNRTGGGGGSGDSEIAFFAMGFNRRWSDDFHVRIAANPWQLFAPQDKLWLPTYSDRVIPQLSNPTVASPTSTGGTPRYTITY